MAQVKIGPEPENVANSPVKIDLLSNLLLFIDNLPLNAICFEFIEIFGLKMQFTVLYLHLCVIGTCEP